MKVASTGICLSAILLVANTLAAGDISGSIRLPAGQNGRRSPAVVYVATRGVPAPSSGQTITVDQRDREFQPRVQAMALGDSIILRNSDSESHNVNSQSGCCSFNYMVAPASTSGPGQSERFAPDKAGLLKLLCNIHSQMRGFVMVCPSHLFAVADALGNFRIPNVPDGRHRLVVWQEGSQQFVDEIDVAGEKSLSITLQSAAEQASSVTGSVSRRVLVWSQVLDQITGTLESAIETAQAPGGAAQADRLALDAYFEWFEGSELETAVLLFRGEQRKFVLERMFAHIRRPLLVDLAAGRTDAGSVRAAVRQLADAIEQDIQALEIKGIVDRTSLGAESGTISAAARSFDAGTVPQVMTDLRVAFDQVARLAESGNGPGAAGALADCYFQVFHRIEPALAAHNFRQVRQLEEQFLELRGAIQSGMVPGELRARLDLLWAEIERAATPLGQSDSHGLAPVANRFGNAFVILTREGVEALLIITALLLYLDRMQSSDGRRWIYGGIAVACVATLITWGALQWLIAQSGLAQETIEGLAALAAGALLFYVSYWLISKSEARRWQQFLARQVGSHLSRGGRWAIGAAAFLAIYREGAETILMFQPMLVRPTASELSGTIAGVIAAAGALAAIFYGLRFASFRLAIRPFFRVTGGLLFVLAIVFAGKAICELQEARVLTISPLPAGLHSIVMWIPSVVRDALGITPTVQSLSIQATILTGALVSLAAVRIVPQPVANVLAPQPSRPTLQQLPTASLTPAVPVVEEPVKMSASRPAAELVGHSAH